VTFADVAGSTEAKDELEEIIQFLAMPKRFTRLGGRIPKGVLLSGRLDRQDAARTRESRAKRACRFSRFPAPTFVEMFVGRRCFASARLVVQGKSMRRVSFYR